MTRYIDADSLLEKICFRLPIDNKNAAIISGCVDITRRIIEAAPTADVVEVRCRDCKHRVEGSKICAHPKAVGWDAIEPEDDDFCSYGERRAEDGTSF